MTCAVTSVVRVVREPQIPGGILGLLCLKFHNILSVCEHEALVYHARHLCNPICNIIACTLAGKQKRKVGQGKHCFGFHHIYLWHSVLSAACLKSREWGADRRMLTTAPKPNHEQANKPGITMMGRSAFKKQLLETCFSKTKCKRAGYNSHNVTKFKQNTRTD